MRDAARRKRRVANQTDSFFAGVVQKVRTETTPFLRTDLAQTNDPPRERTIAHAEPVLWTTPGGGGVSIVGTF